MSGDVDTTVVEVVAVLLTEIMLEKVEITIAELLTEESVRSSYVEIATIVLAVSVMVRKFETVVSDETLVVKVAVPEVISDASEESLATCRTSCSAFSTCAMQASAPLAGDTSI